MKIKFEYNFLFELFRIKNKIFMNKKQNYNFKFIIIIINYN